MASQPQRAQSNERPPIAGEAFLRALADHGIDYFFANPGTDFPPIVEAFSRAKQSNAKVPTPLVIPHENLAVAMAHGAYAMSGRPQAVRAASIWDEASSRLGRGVPARAPGEYEVLRVRARRGTAASVSW